MNSVFLDSVGLLALWDRADQWHTDASAAYRLLRAQSSPFVTTTLVFLECGNAAARRPYRRRVNVFRQALAEENSLIEPSLEDVELAWAAYDRGHANEAGIVDQVSFAVMQRLGIMQAFTNDQHFEAAGFEILF